MVVTLLLGAALAATLSGTVRSSPEGDALSNVVVVAYDVRLGYIYDDTNIQGEFSLRGLHAGAWRVWAIPSEGQNRLTRFYPDARSYCDAERIVLEEDEERTGVDFALEVGGELSGSLVDSSGAPVAGAALECEGASADNSGQSRTATSDEDGAFTVRGLDGDVGEPADWTCRVAADGWPAQYLGQVYDLDDAELISATIGGSTDVGARALLDGILVRGEVNGPYGALAGAYVHVYATSQVVTVSTEADGGYEATGLPPGSVLPWASYEGLALTYYPDHDRPTDWLSAPDEGSIVDDADLTLPEEATFQIDLSPEDDGSDDLSGVTALLYNDEANVAYGARADATGALEIDGLHGGDYRLYVYAADEGFFDGFMQEDGEDLWFTLDGAAANNEGELQIVRSASISGTLVDDQGDPIYGGYVIGYPSDEDKDIVAAVSDIDGTFALPGLAPGRWQITALTGPYCASDPGYVEVYWPGDVVYEAYSSPLDIVADEAYEDVTFVLPRDNDQDGMGDAWEDDHGLDTSADDSALDADEDGFTNLDEYLLGTDPNDASDGQSGCGCKDKGEQGYVGAGLLLLALRRRRR